LQLGTGEEKSDGRNRQSNIACAFEAMLGALYLDGKIDEIKSVVKKLFAEEVEQTDRAGLVANPKALLQEYCQSVSNDVPEYILVDTQGPSHDRVFYVDVYFQGEFLASGKGLTKKAAQKEAAHNACQKLGLLSTGS